MVLSSICMQRDYAELYMGETTSVCTLYVGVSSH